MRVSGFALNRSRQAPAEDTPAFGGIAERFRRAGDLDRAIALCRDGLRKFPNLLSARVTLGWALLDKGLYDEAQAELEQVLRRAPDNLAAIRGLAELHDRAESAVPSMEQQGRWHQPEPIPSAEHAEVVAPAPVAPVLDSPVVEQATASPIEIQTAADAAVEHAERLHTHVEPLEPAALVNASEIVLESASSQLSVDAAESTPQLAQPAALDLAADDDNLAGVLAELDGSEAVAAAPEFLGMESSEAALELVDAELAVAAALDAAALDEPLPVASLQLSAEPVPIADVADAHGASLQELLTFATDAVPVPDAIEPSAATVPASNVVHLETAATSSRATLATLERFLTQVRTRRRQLESVA